MRTANETAPDPNAETGTLRSELESKEAEIARLRSELERIRGKALSLEDSRRAMLYMLEDLNETSATIERAKKEWETTFDSISDPIFLHDREFKILRANRAYLQTAGLPAGEVIGKPYFAVLPRLDAPLTSSVKVLGGEVHEAEEELELPSGKAYKMRVYSVMSPGKKYLHSVGVLEDITESRQSAVEKARLYEKIKEEAEVSASLLAMTETLNTSLEERDLIKGVMGLVPRYMKFDRVGVFFYDEDLISFSFSGGYGFSPVEEGMLLSGHYREVDVPAIAGLLRGETVIVKDASEKVQIGSVIVDSFHIGSAVIVPISFRGKMIGGIYADYRTVREIEQKEVSLLKGLADGMAITLQNTRLYRESIERLMELSGKIETIKTMGQLEREILSTIDKAGILRTAAAIINRIIPCERTGVLIREGDVCKVVSEWGEGELKERAYDLGQCRWELMKPGQEALFLPDISDHVCPYHADLAEAGIRSALFVPLRAKGELLGFLDIGTVHMGRLASENLGTAENVASQITVALENARLYEDLQQLLVNTITSLASTIDAKSPWTKGHSERVTAYAVEIGKEMGLDGDGLERLRLSGLLHDIGKIGTSDKLLDKPDKFTEEEFELVKQHPERGAEILGTIKQLTEIIPGVRHHHERLDGKGYPDGLRGDQIPLQARILCVADAFDAMAADRPYRKAPGREYAISEFKRCAGTQFDLKVVEAFLKVLEKMST
jgi:PAS domain S-box-containing protein/putative nucleotidyltransferase with HDIG domain